MLVSPSVPDQGVVTMISWMARFASRAAVAGGLVNW
jgi:hypothetical protein